MIQTTTPRAGHVSLGIETNIMPAAIEEVHRRGGLVIAQINHHMPYTFGDSEIPGTTIDYAIEVDQLLPSPGVREIDDDADVIGEHIARLVHPGTTLQMGIGLLPDAALGHMRHASHLGVWTEMFSDGVMHLDRAGALDPSRPLTSTFLFGSRELYDWVDQNPRLRMGRTEIVNNPDHIAQQPAMLSINTALQVDLYCQANASYVNGRIYSGFGGQPDFVSGALHSRGGHAVMALKSWHAKSDHSTVVPLIGEPATSFQHSMIVTEHGCVGLVGCSQREQVRQLVEVAADPRARNELWNAARTRGLVA
jgi:acyl-CoA hydrolase